MSKVELIVYSIGWFLIALSWVWPTKKWGGYGTRIVFSAISVGIFITVALYTWIG